MDTPSFAALLRQHRLALGLSQAELAERAGLSERGISDLERGLKRAPRASTVRLLVDGLRLPEAEATALLRAALLPREPLPKASTARARHNLPLATTSFVARKGEMSQLAQRLRDCRLVTITGPGGCGKTRLALEVARAQVGRFADGVWLVELAPLANGALVAQTIIRSLGIAAVARPPAEALTEYLRSRQVLLILDNCEHIIDACAQLVEHLLRACADVQILTTSREMLRVSGEAVWRVASLSVAEPDALARGEAQAVAQLLHTEATRLFVDRARLVAPSFTVNVQNALAVARICQRLDGIPLAIELAAARLAVLSVEQLADRLEKRFDLLADGDRSALRRQQTLRATIDWSYELLSDDERSLLRRLTVFAGSWSLEAAEAVTAGPTALREEAVELLGRLVAKSMVLVEQSPKAEPGVARYRCLETIRQFGEEQLVASGEAEFVRRRHRDWYLGLVEQSLEGMEGPDQRSWWNCLDLEHHNLLAALACSAADEGDTPQLLRMAGVLGRYWQARALVREGIYWLELALARSEGPPSADRARALNWLGELLALGGQPAAAQPVLEQSIAEARAVGDWRLLSLALRHETQVMRSLGHPAEAHRLIEEALAVSREFGPVREIAWNLSVLGLTLIGEGQRDAPEAVLQESIALGRRSGDDSPVLNSLRYLGELYRVRGDFARGRQTAREALAVAQRSGVQLFSIHPLVTLGDLAAAEQDWDSASDWYREALELAGRGGSPIAMADTLKRYAEACFAHGHYYRVVQIYGATSTVAATGNVLLFAPWARKEDILGSTRQALGEDLFAMAWAKGAAMTLEQTIADIVRQDKPTHRAPLRLRDKSTVASAIRPARGAHSTAGPASTPTQARD